MDGNGQLIKLPCACKNLPMHPGCLKEWLKVSDILTCGVCKKNISPSFIQQFVPLEDLLMYPYKSTMPDINNGFIYIERTYIEMPGVSCAELVNGKMVFETDHKKAIFLEAEKRWHMSERYRERHREKHMKEKHMKYKN